MVPRPADAANEIRMQAFSNVRICRPPVQPVYASVMIGHLRRSRATTSAGRLERWSAGGLDSISDRRVQSAMPSTMLRATRFACRASRRAGGSPESTGRGRIPAPRIFRQLHGRYRDSRATRLTVAKNSHEIRDPIHTFVRLDSTERHVLDSRPFQRLRHIHQLALTYLVYPGATHKRFEHSLGVMELAGRVFDIVTNRDNVTDDTRSRLPRARPTRHAGVLAASPASGGSLPRSRPPSFLACRREGPVSR